MQESCETWIIDIIVNNKVKFDLLDSRSWYFDKRQMQV